MSLFSGILDLLSDDGTEWDFYLTGDDGEEFFSGTVRGTSGRDLAIRYVKQHGFSEECIRTEKYVWR